MEHNYKIVRSFELEHKGLGIGDKIRYYSREAGRKIKDVQRKMNKRKKADPDDIKDDPARTSGKKGNRSKYLGGFVTTNGRSNNSQAYNHDYYIHNRDKWLRRGDVKKDTTTDAQVNFAKRYLNRALDIDMDSISDTEIGYNRELARYFNQFGAYDMWDIIAGVRETENKRKEERTSRRQVQNAVSEKRNKVRETLDNVSYKPKNTKGEELTDKDNRQETVKKNQRLSSEYRQEDSYIQAPTGTHSLDNGSSKNRSEEARNSTSGNSGSDKYVSYMSNNMESGTLYKDEGGNIWKKLGGPGTNHWMKIN